MKPDDWKPINQDSITVNMVVKMKSGKETSVGKMQDLINNGNFIAEYIPATFTAQSTGTLIITEKE